MDHEKMDLLWELYQNSNSIKTVDYEKIHRNIFFNQEIFLKEADMDIHDYNFHIKQKGIL